MFIGDLERRSSVGIIDAAADNNNRSKREGDSATLAKGEAGSCSRSDEATTKCMDEGGYGLRPGGDLMTKMIGEGGYGPRPGG